MAQTGLIKQLLEAGVHFGHQTRKWNPKMKRYIFGARNGIYIIDLDQTADALVKACEFLKSRVAEGGDVLFVGTKKQAQDIIKEEAERCGMYFVNQRWLGGTLTNFSTIQKSIGRLKDYQRMKESGELDGFKKKEIMQIKKEMDKLSKNLMGILQMKRLPSVLFVVDPKKDEIAVKEARRLSIPVVSLIDTNADPDMVDFVIPGNDDAIKSIKFVTSVVADAVSEARKAFIENKKREDLAAEDAAAAAKKQKGVEVEEGAIEEVEEVVEKKLKRPDDFQMKMKKRPPRPQAKEGKKTDGKK
jgi:small subunit ribosomal protein S2